jgi:hypothetical protein
MSAGGNASASCTDSSTSGVISITVGAGGAGVQLLDRCLGGGGGSIQGTGRNGATGANLIINDAPRTPCIDPNTNASISGSASGGGSGQYVSSGLDNTGGGGSGVPLDYGRPKGGSGVVLISYDPTFPPVAPIFTTDLQDTTVFTNSLTQETVVATVNDGGTISYSWRKKAPGSNTWENINISTCPQQNVCQFISTSILDSGTVIQAIATNRRSGVTRDSYSRAMVFSVIPIPWTIGLVYPDTNTAVYAPGKTLTPTVRTSHPLISSGTYSTTSAASICTVNSTSGVVSVMGGGACVIRLSVPGDIYAAAVTRIVTINISKIPQTVAWTNLPNVKINSGTVTLGVTSGYPLATGETATGSGSITYSALNCSKFSVSAGGVITPIALGSCSIRATQTSTNYYSAAYLDESLTIVAAAPDAPFINSVSATGGSAPTSGTATVSFTDNGENGASITQYVLRAIPTSGTTIYDTETVGSGTHSGTISGLTLGTDYTIAVQAINSAGSSAFTSYASQVRPAGAPFAVTGLSATPSNGSLAISYTQPASLNGGTWTEYRYFITPAGSAFSDTATATDSNQSHTTFTFNGLTNGTAYNIKVVAITTANGTPSSANTTLLNMVPAATPATPSLSISQLTATSVSINWSSLGDGGSAITSFSITVTKNGANQACYVNLATTSCTLTGLSGRDAINASATATNLIGTSSASTASYSVIGVVQVPTGLTVTAGDSVITISFTQNDSGDAISKYQYTFDGISFTDLVATSSPLDISGLTNDTTYTLYLRAVGAIYGASDLSDTITATPTAYVYSAPPAPSPSYSFSVSPSQTSVIDGSRPPFGYSDTTTILTISGKFLTTVTSITINARVIDAKLWNQNQTTVVIYMQPHAVETVTIQLINDLLPALPEISFAYIKRPATTIVQPVPPSTPSESGGSSAATPTIRKITIQLTVPFRRNSYFLNDAAKREIAAVVKKYNRLNVEKYIVLAYSTASKVNPYPTFLGTWRSKAVYKQMVADGMQANGSARYGGLFKGKRALAYRAEIVFYLKP